MVVLVDDDGCNTEFAIRPWWDVGPDDATGRRLRTRFRLSRPKMKFVCVPVYIYIYTYLSINLLFLVAGRGKVLSTLRSVLRHICRHNTCTCMWQGKN